MTRQDKEFIKEIATALWVGIGLFMILLIFQNIYNWKNIDDIQGQLQVITNIIGSGTEQHFITK